MAKSRKSGSRQIKSFVLIGMILFATLIIVSVYVVSNNIQDIRSRATDKPACQVVSIATAKDCFNQLNQGTVDTVEITNQIICSGARGCELPGITVNRPISIRGTNTGAGFRRTDHYDYDILTLSGSSQVTVSNLAFDDTQNFSCSDPSSCYGVPINIFGGSGSNFVFDKINVSNSPFLGLEIRSKGNITVKNSTFSNMGQFAIWGTAHFDIENNTFQNMWSNAILADFVGTTSAPSIIKNNYFINNHKVAVFDVCGGGTKPCPGGQIYITSSNNLVISNNTIKDGSLNIGTYGMELDGGDQDLTIKDNDIHNNTGWPIFSNSRSTNTTNVNILNNMIYGNGHSNTISYAGANISGNCFSAGCNSSAGFRSLPTLVPSPTSTTPPARFPVYLIR